MKALIVWLLVLVVFLFPGAACLHSAEIIPLEDILNPETVTADKDQLYITTGAKIHIYSLPDYRFKKSFGQQGAGPGEFKKFNAIGVQLDVQSDHILVTSQGKISSFTKLGEFIKERRIPYGYDYRPLGDKFLIQRGKPRNNLRWKTLNLYDKNLENPKELADKKDWFQPGQRIDPIDVKPPRFCTYKNRIYVENKANNIDIFDSEGRLLFSTTQNFDRLRVSEKDKENYHDYYKIHPGYKRYYRQLKHLFVFPEYYPSMKYFDVSNDALYVFTYIKKDNRSELYIFNLDGQLKKKTYLSIPDINPQQYYPLVKVSNGKIYQVIETEDEDEWELHVTEIPR
ncbi:MAG: hypothetical protein GY940_33435 [bacterium]|nr:hypothetical protein [bacterium]